MSNRDHFDSGRTGQPIPVTDGAKPKVKPVTIPTFVPKPRPEPKPDEFLGVAVNRGEGKNDANSIASAELLWQKENPTASKELDRADAQGLAKSIVNHPSMDFIPGIEDIRANFDPKQISFHKQLNKKDAERSNLLGAHYSALTPTDGNINQLQFSTGYKPRHPQGRVKLGVVTHEVAHYLLENSSAPVPKDHDWPMARLHLHIIKSALSNPKAHNDLKRAYDDSMINYGETLW